MIRLYPSARPGNPIESHEHEPCTFHEWMVDNVTNYSDREHHPIEVFLNGKRLDPLEWKWVVISPQDELRINPILRGPVALPAWAVWTIVAVTVASAAFSIYMALNVSSKVGDYASQETGESLDTTGAKANSVKLGQPIPEVFGRYRVYPQYLSQPIGRFVNKTDYEMTLFLCLSVGRVAFSQGDVRVGSTPSASFGDDFKYKVFGPGEDVSGDDRTKLWYANSEVGSTSSGTSGLDLGSTYSDDDSIEADTIYCSGNNATFINAVDNDNKKITKLPDEWSVGRVITLEVPDTFLITSQGLYSLISSSTLEEISPEVGLPVSVKYLGSRYDLFISSYTPASGGNNGVEGTPSKLISSNSPTQFDFSSSPESFTISFRGVTLTITLDEDYQDIYGVVVELQEKLLPLGISVINDFSRVVLTEALSPYSGSIISGSGLPTGIFGSSPRSEQGIKTIPSTDATLPGITLSYDSPTGTPFSGLPLGAIRLSIASYTSQYKLSSVDGLTLGLSKLDSSSNVISWNGFSSRSSMDYTITGVNEGEIWVGPFLAVPEGKTSERIEMDFSFPNGLCGYDDRGNKRNTTTHIEIQYRRYGLGEGWTSIKKEYTNASPDACGFTESLELGGNYQVEVRVRRTNEQGANNARDTVYWKGLRSILQERPTSYPGITTMAITFITGNKVSSQSDRRINIDLTRIYSNNYPSRSISGAMYHLLESLGMDSNDIDYSRIDSLESQYWTPRGETFNFVVSDTSTSALDLCQMIAKAGMGYFLLRDGVCSMGREGIKPWRGMLTPQNTLTPLKTSFTLPSLDDNNGVDIKYTNGQSWTEETIECRLPGIEATKIDTITLKGVVDPNVAYRLGMRELRKNIYSRVTHSTSTELEALVYDFMDVLLLTDDIPGSENISCQILDAYRSGDKVYILPSEELDWGYNNPIVVIRLQDGDVTGRQYPTEESNGYFSIPFTSSLKFGSWRVNDNHMETLTMVFSSSSERYYQGILTEVNPDSSGTCDVVLTSYTEDLYLDDNSTLEENV